MSGVVQRVDKSVESTPEDEYKSLLRSLRRRKGFGLAFVRCSPVGGVELIKKVRDDLPQKQIGVLELDQPIDNLINRVKDVPNQAQLNILFVVGLEKSLVDYIQTGYGGEGDYYNLDTIPPILSHLNWQRENFRDRFRHLCFVFLLPRFAIKYIIRRAPDFYDWASGKIDIPSSQEFVAQESQRIFGQDYDEYLEWTPQQCKERILEINELLLESNRSQDQQSSLLLEQGNIFYANNQYEEAIASYDKALEIKPDYYKAWENKGGVMFKLGQYEKAITAYDKALSIQPNYYQAWNNQGNGLLHLNRYEEAISAYDKSIAIKSDFEQSYFSRGIALFSLGKNEEAIISIDKALEIKPDDPNLYYNKACAYSLQKQIELALESLKKAIQLNSKKYREMSKTDSNFDNIRHDPRFQALIQ
jgi:superkiller protein 3